MNRLGHKVISIYPEQLQRASGEKLSLQHSTL